MTDALEKLPADRFAQLIEQLGQDLGKVRGWQSKVAAMTGSHRSYISRVSGGDRSGVGPAVLARAANRLGMSEDFFYEPHLGDKTSYKDWMLDEGSASPTASFLKLVRPLLGHRGSVKMVAESVGITPEHMSRVLNGHSMVSERTLALAEKQLCSKAEHDTEDLRAAVDELAREMLQLKLRMRRLEAAKGRGRYDF